MKLKLLLYNIKEYLQQSEKKIILENFFSLSVLQISNYILPLITLPYLVRVLGPEKFGLISFSQAFLQYLILVIDFGFNLSATREISINRNNKLHVSKIFLSVFLIKVLLLLVSLIISLTLILSFQIFKKESLFYFLSLSSLIGWVLFPQWFFQGIENMKFITIVNFISKFVFTLLIFIFIHKSSDYLAYPLLNFIGLFIAGAISLIIIFKKYEIIITFPDTKIIINQFKLGLQIFIANVATNLYTTSNSFLLGIFTNNTIVGYYSAAEKIYKAFQFLSVPLYQTLFPRFSKIISENKERAIVLFNKLIITVFLITLLLSTNLFFFSSTIVKTLLGNNYPASAIIFSILSIALIFSWENYALGICGLVNFGYEKEFSKIVLIGGFLHIILVIPAIRFGGYILVPIVYCFTEILIFIICIIFLNNLGLIKRVLLLGKNISVFKKMEKNA